MRKLWNWLDSLPKGVHIGGGLIMLMIAVGVCGYLFLAPKAVTPPSSTRSMKTTASGGAVGGEGTPQYNQMIDEINAIKAAEAEAKGESFLPIPIGDEKVIEPPKPEPAPIIVKAAPPAPVAKPAPTPRRQTPPAKVESNKAMEADLKSIIQRTRPVVGTPSYVLVALAETGEYGSDGAKARTAGQTAAAVAGSDDSKEEILSQVKIGDVFYAINQMAINSDAASPVVATIVMGPLKGAKVFGAFERNDTTLVVAFNRLVLPDGGSTVNMTGFAVDPQTSSADVSSDVDTHFWSRWGSLLAASFLQGFGEAMTDKNESATVDTGNTVVTSRDGKSYKDVTLEAFGKVGENAATILMQNFNRPPTVYLNAGQPLGVLILDLQRR